MAEKTAILYLRIDPQLKAQAEILFDDLGLSTSSACTLFIKQAVRQGKIPFEIAADTQNSRTDSNEDYICEYCGKTEHTPNKKTITAMRAAEKIAHDPNVKSHKNVNELFADIIA